MENKPNISMILAIVVVMIIAAVGIGLMMYNKEPAPTNTTTTIQATTTSQVTATTVAPTTIPPTTQATTTLPGTPTTTLSTTTTYNIPAGSKVYNVEMINLQFVPKDLTIKKGDTVTWINNDILGDNPRQHMINQFNGEFRSERLGYKETYSYTFNTPGSYLYSDAIYPKQMRGTITVLDEQGSMPTGSFIAQLNPMSGNPILFLLIAVIIAGMATGYVLGFRKQSY